MKDKRSWEELRDDAIAAHVDMTTTDRYPSSVEMGIITAGAKEITSIRDEKENDR